VYRNEKMNQKKKEPLTWVLRKTRHYQRLKAEYAYYQTA
jgi:hypothetical protein